MIVDARSEQASATSGAALRGDGGVVRYDAYSRELAIPLSVRDAPVA